MFFKDINVNDGDITYLCEYIPKSKLRDFGGSDSRSENLVLDFKRKVSSTINMIADYLEGILGSDFALAAVPSSKVASNGLSASHELIDKIVSDIGNSHNLINAGSCLYRHTDKPAAHEQQGPRTSQILYDTLTVNDAELIQNKDVLIIDDVTTSGKSIEVAMDLLKRAGAKKVVGFVIGKTITNEQLRTGFIFDLDNTLFLTDSIKSFRDNRQWNEANKLAAALPPVDGAIEFIKYIKSRPDMDFRIVTSSPREYAKILISKLGIEESKLIAYSDTVQHKPNIEPYCKAKQQMMIYEPCIIAIGDNDMTDIAPAKNLNMISVLIGKSATYLYQPNFIFNSLLDAYQNIDAIITQSKEIRLRLGY